MTLTVTYVGHATVVIDVAGTRLVTDPLLRRRLGHVRRAVALPQAAAVAEPDAVLVSHVHADHLSPPDLRRLRAGRVVVPAQAARWRGLRGVAGVEGVSAGERLRVGACDVLAVPSAHGRRRLGTTLAAAPLGFIIEAGRRIYFAGDTDRFEGMRAFAPVDVALVPVWGWGPRVGPGHMDPERAAAALDLLRPRVAIPIHWGTYIADTVVRDRARFLREPPLAFARAAARIAPDVDVRILAPGGAVTLT